MNARRRTRAGSHTQMIFLTVGFLIVVVLVMILTSRHPAPHNGTPTVKPLYEGINLPVADAAKPGEPSPETTLEIPLAWGDNETVLPERLRGKMESWERAHREDRDEFDDIHARRPFIIAADRDLQYRALFMAALVGRDAGFVIHKFACRTSEGGNVGYLTLELPRAVGPWYPDDNNPAILLVVSPEDGQIQYRITETTVESLWQRRVVDEWVTVTKDGKVIEEFRPVEPPKPEPPVTVLDSLDEVGRRIRTGVADTPEFGCMIRCHEALTVQQFVDVYNTVLNAGCYRILLDPPILDKKQETP